MSTSYCGNKNFFGDNLGLVLVLFILLVIIGASQDC